MPRKESGTGGKTRIIPESSVRDHVAPGGAGMPRLFGTHSIGFSPCELQRMAASPSATQIPKPGGPSLS